MTLAALVNFLPSEQRQRCRGQSVGQQFGQPAVSISVAFSSFRSVCRRL